MAWLLFFALIGFIVILTVENWHQAKEIKNLERKESSTRQYITALERQITDADVLASIKADTALKAFFDHFGR
ncbi:MAG: hypothetical protein BGO01_03755 [Armatimonadetes bacterium 55-13]|nr:hypothetical protein [Armatimonadota bacterium]OJU63062.1 MAG: hypothetical protein BGO01_03755 [Armatimonadetes bacterium 55-13]